MNSKYIELNLFCILIKAIQLIQYVFSNNYNNNTFLRKYIVN